MLILLGYLVVLGTVFGGYLMTGGSLGALYQPAELVIIAGAGIGSFIVGNNGKAIKGTLKALPLLFRRSKYTKAMYMDLLALLYRLMAKSRQMGMFSLERDIENPRESEIFASYPRILADSVMLDFIVDYLRLIISGHMNTFEIEALMDEEIETHESEAEVPANSLALVGDSLPAFGIVAAVMGVVHALGSADRPAAELGALIAHAMVGTFLGILLAYGFISPLATVLRQKSAETSKMMQCVKVTLLYADIMTAMMAFFLVMWLISISSPKELIQIAEYFRTPLATAVTGGDRISNSESPIPGGGDDYTQSQGEVNKQPNIEELKKRMEQSRLRKLRGDLDQLIESDPKLRALRPHLKIDLVQEGLRIQIIDSQNRPMFRTGSADVEPYMRDILRAIAPVLNGIPNRISLSGHTDDFPYASGEKGYSNWELSADRANASRRELMVGGLDSGKVLRVVGMAATMRLSDRGPDDAVNRRISLLVLNKQAEQAILHENAESQNEPVSALEKPEVAPQVSVPTMPSAEPR